MTRQVLVPGAVIDDAAANLTQSAQWMRTQQAAVMRLLPEQMSATNWWASQHGGDFADTALTVPAWIRHCYGVEVSATATPGEAVHQLLTVRAKTVKRNPLYLITDPQLRAVLISLAHTPTYRRAATHIPLTSGTVMFAEPILFTQSDSAATSLDGAPSTGDHKPAQLHGVTWTAEPSGARTIDWISTRLDTTGNSYIDDTITKAIDDKKTQLPPLITNGEWMRPASATTSVDESRVRISTAAQSIFNGETQRWSDELVENDDTLLAARLAEVCADAIGSGFAHANQRRVTRRAGTTYHRSVGVLAVAE